MLDAAAQANLGQQPDALPQPFEGDEIEVDGSGI